MESIRTCLVCRTKTAKENLCRFVRAVDGEICFDEKGSLLSRGVWICANKTCLLKGLKKRLLFRSEKTLPINVDDMVNSIQSRIKSNALSRLGLLRRLGQIEIGREACIRSVRKDKAFTVVVAKDFSNRSVNEIREKMEKEIRVLRSPFLMAEIGQSLGRNKTGVVALPQSRITEEVVRQMEKLKELEQ